MGAMARQGPHQVAQKSTRTGCSDFKTSWSKFASVTSTIPLPAIVFLLVVKRRAVGLRSTSGVAGTDDRAMSASREGLQFNILALRFDAEWCAKVAKGGTHARARHHA